MPRLDEALVALATMSPAQLRGEWRRVHRAPPPALTPDLLARGIAYRLQERVQGGLPQSLRRELAKLAKRIARTGDLGEDEIVIKPGTRLARDWHGRTHHVHVLDDGFLYQDRCYRSLTQIARAITGAGWSGPRFFGLKRRPKPFAEASDG